MVGPLSRVVEVGPGDARCAFAVSDVGAATVHAGEVHFEQLVAQVESEEEGVQGIGGKPGVQLVLGDVFYVRGVVLFDDIQIV